MPPWAEGIRIENIKPSFDVFSLGKVLWSIVSGKKFLRSYDFNDNEFNVELLFQSDNNMWQLNRLLEMCIVKRENNCLPDAGIMLKEIDKTINNLQNNIGNIGNNSIRICKVCGDGNYLMISDGKPHGNAPTLNFGLTPTGNRMIKIFSCENCGHVQLFETGSGNIPPQWDKL